MQIFKTEMTFVVSCALCLFIEDLSKCRESHCLKHKDTAQADLLHLLANGQQHDYKQEIGVFLTSVFTLVITFNVLALWAMINTPWAKFLSLTLAMFSS